MDNDVLAVYRMMPTTEVEQLLEHIEWLERELQNEKNIHNSTEEKLKHLTRLLNRHKRDVAAELERFGRRG
ncbi:MAG: hypothetical protein R2834_23500 [Rhodothermales bacterium]